MHQAASTLGVKSNQRQLCWRGGTHLANLESRPGHHPQVEGDEEEAHKGVHNDNRTEGPPVWQDAAGQRFTLQYTSNSTGRGCLSRNAGRQQHQEPSAW